MKEFFVSITLFIFCGNLVFASVEITEIMYDPSGSDTNREWLEVHNGGADIDFTKWKFFEADTNHSIASTTGSVFPSGAHAVIVKDKASFVSDFPSFSGLIFDSSWSSFVNSGGEPLSIKDENGNVTDSVTYNPALTDEDSGKSLQKISGSWVAAMPNPGTGDSNAQSGGGTSPQSPPNDSSPSIASLSNFPIEPKIFVSAGKDLVALAGAEIILKGEAYGTDKSPLAGARYVWALGDGSIREGKEVRHTYRYPGKYIAVVDISSGMYSASDRASIEVVEPLLFISSLGSGSSHYVEIQNKTSYEIDLGGWQIVRSGNPSFIIPPHTIILPTKKLIFPEEVIGYVAATTGVFLVYPNGKTLSEFRTQNDASVPNPPKLVETISPGKPDVQKVSSTSSAPVENLVSSIGAASPIASRIPFSYWVIGLTAFLGAIAFFLRRFLKDSFLENNKSEADLFEIIEKSE